MLRLPRCYNIRILGYLLVLSGLFYFCLHDSIPTPTLKPPQPKTKYASRATYEYTSIYRQHANHTFEAALDAQLLALEHSTRSSLPANSQNLIANHTIHQIATPKLESQMSGWINQWRTNNPGWTYSLLTEYPASLLAIYSNISSLQSAYEDLSLRPDLTRYLLLWYHGGLYSDINTWQRVSLKDCAPIVDVTQGGKDVSLMVGVERDEPFYNRKTIEDMGWSRGFGFGVATIWAVRRFDPVIRTAIVRSISHLQARRELDGSRGWSDDWDVFQPDWEDWERSEISGAGMLTDVVLGALSSGLKDGHELRDWDAGLERRVSWKKLKGIKDVLWIDPSQAREGVNMAGIAISPIDVWSNGQNHSGSGTFEADGACVNHVNRKGPKKAWYEKGFWR